MGENSSLKDQEFPTIPVMHTIPLSDTHRRLSRKVVVPINSSTLLYFLLATWAAMLPSRGRTKSQYVPLKDF